MSVQDDGLGPLGEAALAYAARHIPVFPLWGITGGKCDCGDPNCKNAGKHPVGRLVPNGIKDATTDPTVIADWWRKYPNANIGAPSGEALGLPLDVDPRHGGNESLAALVAEHGELPEGPLAETGNGGSHRYFAWPGGTVPIAHGFRPGLDFQGSNTYVVLPPSNHASGKQYRWIHPLNGHLPLLPAWLFRAATEVATEKARTFPMTPGGKIPHGQHHDWIVSTAASIVSRTPGIGYDDLLRTVRGIARELLDDFESHDGKEIENAVKSAILKYQPQDRAAPPRAPSGGGVTPDEPGTADSSFPTVPLREVEFEDGKKRVVRDIALGPNDCLRSSSYTFTADPETKEVRTTVTYSSVVGVPFRPRRYVDEAGSAWITWEEPGGGTIRGPLPEFVKRVRDRFSLGPSEASPLAKWIEALPVAGQISTVLRLTPPKDGLSWRVPRAFGREGDRHRRDSVSRLASWYRPRGRDIALARQEGLKPFAIGAKLRMILLWAFGCVVTALLAPWRPRVELNLTGDSGTGKTTWWQTTVSVAWALGGLEKEVHGKDAVESGFRWLDLLAATNLPVLFDETRLSPEEREELRSALSGGQAGRGGTDLLQREYSRDASVGTATNRSDDDIDLSASELHGTRRRRISLVFESDDKELIQPNLEKFNVWLQSLRRDLVEGKDDYEGGGAGVWLLRDHEKSDPGLGRLREIANDPRRSDRQAVVDVGAELLGMKTVTVPPDEADPAGDAFLSFLRSEEARYKLLIEDQVRDNEGRPTGRIRKPDDPIFARIRFVVLEREKGGVDWLGYPGGTVTAYVTLGELRHYASECRRAGRNSPFHTLTDLRALAVHTGQSADEICETGRAGSYTKRIAGTVARVALVDLGDGEEETVQGKRERHQKHLQEPEDAPASGGAS